MKFFFLILFLFITTICCAQVSDNFSDGDFANNPSWSGDTIQWEVLNGMLHSNDTVASDIFYLSAPSATATNAQWEFWDSLQFNTSSLNYIDIYLISDSANLKATSFNGFFVRIGNTQDDICLYKRTGSTTTKIIDGADGILNTSNNVSRIKVIRDTANLWTLERDLTGTGNNFVIEGTITDTNFQTSSFFGVVVKQSTASFFRKHFFDDFYAGPTILDTIPPALTGVNVISSTQLDVHFNEQVDSSTAQNINNYSVNNVIGPPATAQRDLTDLTLAHLTFSASFQNSLLYTITANNISDLSGNILPANSTADFVLPEAAQPNDIIINEILYNPNTGGEDFVELYNRSSRVINLNELNIASGDYDTQILDDINIITTEDVFLFPDGYAVLTESPEAVMSQYYSPSPATFVQVASLPAYNIDYDIAALVDAAQAVIDRLSYSDTWHFPLLNDSKGVSLERINPNKQTQDSTNWHSAAESAGFATPGYRNSQYSETSGDGSEISIAPEIFSPDNDGHNDVVNINYHFDAVGYTANVIIYDSRGRYVRNLVKNELLGTSGSFTWDGVNDKREKSSIGIYIVFVEVFRIDGTVKSFKKTCVLASRL
ncbi:MAG TPA: lamin tail domain-containing protein [Bacteroidia bacterium]|nr:lamin tail domain-containing protein [Bacteroidia bacterium]